MDNKNENKESKIGLLVLYFLIFLFIIILLRDWFSPHNYRCPEQEQYNPFYQDIEDVKECRPLPDWEIFSDGAVWMCSEVKMDEKFWTAYWDKYYPFLKEQYESEDSN